MKKAHLNPIGPVYCSSKSSVRMLEREMFEKNSYLRNGIELHKGSVIIDAGANIGIFTLFVNYKCQNDCQVYSFEPIPDTFEILKRNICLYGLQESVNPFNLGLTYIDGPEETEFTVYKEHDTISTMYPHVKEVTNLQPMKNSENFAAILKLFHSPYYHLAKVPIIKNIIQRIYLSRYPKFRVRDLNRVSEAHFAGLYCLAQQQQAMTCLDTASVAVRRLWIWTIPGGLARPGR